jgi:hypothetical protein
MPGSAAARGLIKAALFRTAFVQLTTFEAFTETNDPHGEHDFSSFEHGGVRIFWKIDAYADDTLTYGAAEP